MHNTSKRILIIDPDPRTREEYTVYFLKNDYEVEASAGFTSAVEKLKNIKFDCIIVDVNLPEIKGYESVKIIKTIDPKVEVIITAAENSMELEEKVRKQDILYYYIKSFDMEELKLAVSNVFKKKGKIKEVKKMNHPAKILIIDDDPDFVDATRIILEKKPYNVETAFNRNEAIKKINRFKPDLIILDIMMDRLDDGFTICYKLKHDTDLKNIPVFAISSITEKTGFKFSPKTDGEYFEADDYAEKPIEANNLLNRIEKLLER